MASFLCLPMPDRLYRSFHPRGGPEQRGGERRTHRRSRSCTLDPILGQIYSETVDQHLVNLIHQLPEAKRLGEAQKPTANFKNGLN